MLLISRLYPASCFFLLTAARAADCCTAFFASMLMPTRRACSANTCVHHLTTLNTGNQMVTGGVYLSTSLSHSHREVGCNLLYSSGAATIVGCYRTCILIVALLSCLLREQHHKLGIPSCFTWLRNEHLCFMVHCLAVVLHAAATTLCIY